jgi:hypothetical protein
MDDINRIEYVSITDEQEDEDDESNDCKMDEYSKVVLRNIIVIFLLFTSIILFKLYIDRLE